MLAAEDHPPSSFPPCAKRSCYLMSPRNFVTDKAATPQTTALAQPHRQLLLLICINCHQSLGGRPGPILQCVTLCVFFFPCSCFILRKYLLTPSSLTCWRANPAPIFILSAFPQPFHCASAWSVSVNSSGKGLQFLPGCRPCALLWFTDLSNSCGFPGLLISL
jgi:hypothetical protein